MFRNVLVGVDEDEGGRDAIALAVRLITEGGELTVAHVFHEGGPVPRERTYSDVLDKREAARQMLERTSAEAGVTAHIRWRGAPSVGRGLHELAEIVEADLLVVGSSERPSASRLPRSTGRLPAPVSASPRLAASSRTPHTAIRWRNSRSTAPRSTSSWSGRAAMGQLVGWCTEAPPSI